MILSDRSSNYTHPLILSAAEVWSSVHPSELGVDEGVTIEGSVSADGSADGDRVLTFTVPEDPTGTLLEDVSTLYYKCVNHSGMTGEAIYGDMDHFDINPADFDAEAWTINTDYLNAYAAGKELDNISPSVDIDDDEVPDLTEAAGELIMDILSNALVMELNDEDTTGMVDADAGTITLADGGFEVVLSGTVVTDVGAPDQTDIDSVTDDTNIVSITVTDTFDDATVIETSSVDIPWEDISIYIDV